MQSGKSHEMKEKTFEGRAVKRAEDKMHDCKT